MKNKRFSRGAAMLLAVLLTAALMGGTLSAAGCQGKAAFDADGETLAGKAVTVADSYSDIYNSIAAFNQQDYTDAVANEEVYFENAPEIAADGSYSEEPMTGAAAYSTTADSASENGISSPEYSGTNVQVSGVDEADIIKTDGSSIYMLRDRKLTIVDAGSLSELCNITLDIGDECYPQELYLSGSRLAVISSSYYWAYVNEEADGSDSKDSLDDICHTIITIYDVSDRTAPAVAGELRQSGIYSTSRMINGCIYCISNESVALAGLDEEKPDTYVPVAGSTGCVEVLPANGICLFDNAESASYCVVSSFDINKCEQFSSVKAAFGCSGNVYASTDSLVITSGTYSSERVEGKLDGKNAVTNISTVSTDVLVYSISGGTIVPKASGSIPGRLLNQFSIDEYNGYYRFVTTIDNSREIIYTDGIDQYEWESEAYNALYVADETMSIVGRLEGLAEDEQVYSVRFDGNTAYFVTFRQTDPLFTADLSEPTAPRVIGELKLPGFSSYLHNYDTGLLFGLGMNADDEGRTDCLKLSMYDTSDPANVTELHTLLTDYGYSEGLYNHKAILVDSSRALIAFPVDNGYEVYTYDRTDGFRRLAYADSGSEWSFFFRGLFIDNDFFICSGSRIDRFDIPSFDNDGTLVLSPYYDEAITDVTVPYTVNSSEG